MIGTDGERELGNSVVSTQHDDDKHVCVYVNKPITYMIYKNKYPLNTYNNSNKLL